MTSTTYRDHRIDLGSNEGRPVATIRRGRRHCLTVRGRLSGSHDRTEEVKAAALDAVTAAHNGASWSALATQTGPRGRLIRELEP